MITNISAELTVQHTITLQLLIMHIRQNLKVSLHTACLNNQMSVFECMAEIHLSTFTEFFPKLWASIYSPASSSVRLYLDRYSWTHEPAVRPTEHWIWSCYIKQSRIKEITIYPETDCITNNRCEAFHLKDRSTIFSVSLTKIVQCPDEHWKRFYLL